MYNNTRFTSPSTPSVKHDAINLLVEAILVNKYKHLPEYPWRKGKKTYSEWGYLVKVLKRLVLSLSISPDQLCWYIRKYRVTKIDFNDFGLVRWSVRKYFRYGNLQKFALFYRKLNDINKPSGDHYIDNGKFVTKKYSNRQKTLSSVLSELEELKN